MATNTTGTLNLQTSIVSLHNGTSMQSLKAGQANTIKVKAGEHYRIVKSVDGEEQLLDDVIATRSGDDLQLQYADGTRVTLENFYAECTTAAACDVTLPGQDAGGYQVSGQNAPGTALGDGSSLIYAHGSHDVLMGMAQGNASLHAVLSGIAGTELTYIPPADGIGSMGLLGAVGGGLLLAGAAAAGGGGGGGGGGFVPRDNTAPTVISVAITSAIGAMSPVNAGDVVSITVMMSEATIVDITGGTPQLALDIGGTIVQASYATGSGTTALVFTYIIQAGQTDADGISIPADSLTLNGGTLTDAAGNAAILTYVSVADNGTYVVDTSAPTVSDVAITSATGVMNSTLNAGDVVSVTVTMSEATTVTGTPQLTLNIGGTPVQAGYASGSGTTALVFTYTIQAGQTDADGISIAADSLTLNGGTLTDAAGNAAILSHALVADNSGYLVDTLAPTVSITSDVNAVKIGETATITFTFSEDPGASFVAGDIATTGGTLSALSVTADPLVYTTIFTPTPGTASGTASISVANGSYADAAGNPGTAGTTPAISIDTLAPTVAITLADSALTKGETTTVTFTFSEVPTGFDLADVTVENGALSAFTVTADPLVYTATYTPTADLEDATNMISVGTGYTDAAGNTGTAAASANYSIDTLAPTVAITLADSTLTKGETTTVTFTFSEVPTGFDLADVTVENGTLSAFTVTADPLVYTATYTPTDDLEDATNMISVGTGYTDAAGNTGTAAASANYTIDTLAPSVTITSDVSAVKIGETATITFTFSDDPVGTFADEDIATTGGTLSPISGTADPLVYTAIFTPTPDTASGTASITVANGSYTDAAGDAGTAGTTPVISIDTLAPTVAITLADSTLTKGETTTVTFTFSEVPTGFDLADVTVENGALSAFTVTADPLVYTATYTPTDALEDATNMISVGTGYTDAAGNTGTAAASANYSIDTLAPTVAITLADSTLTKGETTTVTFTFSEVPTGFDLADVTVENGALSAFTVTADPLVYTATYTPTDDLEDATNMISVGTGYTDAAGNTGTAAASANYTIDTLAPSVTITSDVSAVKIGETATITFTFSDDPVGTFADEDIATTGGTLSPISVRPIRWSILPSLRRHPAQRPVPPALLLPTGRTLIRLAMPALPAPRQ